jgi:hypothetical protein
MTDWVMENLLGPLIVVAMALLLVILGAIIVDLVTSRNAQSFELAKRDWQCTSTFETRRFNGKVWYTATECAQYSRKGAEQRDGHD